MNTHEHHENRTNAPRVDMLRGRSFNAVRPSTISAAPLFRHGPALFVLLCILLGPASALSQPWRKHWVTNRDNGFTGLLLNPAMIVDRHQAVHLMFAGSQGADEGENQRGVFDATLYYASNARGEFEGPEETVTGRMSPYPGFGIDSSGVLHGMFPKADGSDIPCITYLAAEPDRWEPQGTGSCASIGQTAPAVAADATGGLHVVYEQAGAVYYTHRSREGVWQTPVNLSGEGAADRTPVIAVTPGGKAHILFYRWNTEARRTLMYVAGSGTTFTRPQTLRVMTGTRTGLEHPFLTPPFIPSITLDADSLCHVVFTSIVGIDPRLSQLLYMNGRDGVWSDPVPITGLALFDKASVFADSRGDLHVAAERYDSVGRDWDIVYLNRIEGTWSSPVDVTDNDVDDFAPASGGRFIQGYDSGLAIVYQSYESNPEATKGNPGDEIVVLTKRLAPQPALEITPDIIDFGTIRVGTCTDTTVVVRNIGAGTISYGAAPQISDDAGYFTVDHVDDNALLSTGADTVTIRFCPTDSGCFRADLTIFSDVGSGSVRLLGCSIPNPREVVPRTLRLDTVSGHVGDRLVLTCSIDPPPVPSDNVEDFDVLLEFDRHALYPLRIVEGIGATVAALPGGAVRVSRSSTQPVVGPVLFRLAFEGLMTGQPENVVEIASAALNGSPDSVSSSDGLVYLEGCDIGRNPGYARTVRIDAVIPSPIVGRARIRWRAPEGIHPTLRVINSAGEVVHVHTLPAGTGSEETTELSVPELAPGWYLLEIVDRAERRAIPILIAE